MTAAPHAPTLFERLALAADAPRCLARTRAGSACKGPAMQNGRCRMHGGKSTGAVTQDGAARAREAALRHGYYTAAAVRERREARVVLVGLRKALAATELRQALVALPES